MGSPKNERLLIQVRCRSERSSTNDYPNDFTVPWPESDRLDGYLWATISAMITIGKAHIWNTGSACFEPPIEEGAGGGYLVVRTSLAGDQVAYRNLQFLIRLVHRCFCPYMYVLA
jgi:hypothetical protein